ncbi:AbiV family abortive infection protein [Gordonia bronchialis]|uniref:AbiV family abortive infection protein n=1 Tax=Gordonia bronchialis TaxID=2054 RepID=UPI001CBE9750|nr:AbiV family abortive infection protein [Gordonia bronchialis]UAK38814.1 AbiV family abortive infection protein [Gordonia bronchialis]
MSAENARHFWRALMANAVALVEDADTLLGAGSPGRARSLLILAQEELARARAVYGTASPFWDQGGGTVELSPRPGSRAHLSVSRDHREKISATDNYARNLGPFWGDYSAWENGATAEPARVPVEVDAQKQAGLYVSSAPGKGGRFSTPLDYDDTESVAAELLRVAQVAEMALIEDHTRRQDRDDPDEFVSKLHWLLLPLAHPEEYADYIAHMEHDTPRSE